MRFSLAGIAALMLICLLLRTKLAKAEGERREHPPSAAGGSRRLTTNNKGPKSLLRQRQTVQDRIESTIARARLHRLRNRHLTRQQRNTQDELQRELAQLRRRPRWTPSGNPNYSLYSRQYSNSGVYLRRTMEQINTRVQTLVVDVSSLKRWKSATDRRLERLEASLSDSNRRISEHSRHLQNRIQDNAPRGSATEVNSQEINNLQTNLAQLQEDLRTLESAVNSRQIRSKANILDESTTELHEVRDLPTRHGISGSSLTLNGGSHSVHLADEVRNHGLRLDSHDTILRKSAIDITSLQHQLVRIIMKNKRQDSSIRLLQSLAGNFSVPSGELLQALSNMRLTPDRSGELRAMRDMLNDHNTKINKVQRVLEESQSNVVVLSKKSEILSSRIDEVRNRADETSLAVRVHGRNIEEMTGKLQVQLLIIKRLQQTLLGQQRFISRLNRNLLEAVAVRTNKINATLQTSLTKAVAKASRQLQESVNELQADITENKNSLEEATGVVTVQSEQIRNNDLFARNLETFLTQRVMSADRNISQLLQRLSYNERNFIGINRKLERLQNKENSFERTTTSRLTVLESTVNGDRENFRGMVPSSGRSTGNGVDEQTLSTVLFLNSSFYQIRAAVQRQSSGFDRLSSRVLRLSLAEERANNRITRLQEKLDKSSSKTHNVSSSLHRMIASDIASLRKTVATRVDTLSREAAELASDVRSLSSQHSELSDTVTTFVARIRADVTDAKAKSSEVARKQEANFQVFKEFRDQISEAINQLNETTREECAEDRALLSALEENIQSEIAGLKLRTSELETNSSDHVHHLSLMRRSMHRMHRNLASYKTAASAIGSRVTSLEASDEEDQRRAQLTEDRLNTVDSSLKEYGPLIVSSKLKLDFLQNMLETTRAVGKEFRNVTRRDLLQLRLEQQVVREAHERSAQHANHKMKRLSEQLAQINEERGIKQAEQNKRLLALETLKGTFLSGLGQCQDHVRRVQISIGELRAADAGIRDSIELHAKALTEHKKLHRNLTALSDGVSQTVHEHDQALEIVQTVVVRLNATIMEEQDHIDDAVSTRIQRYMRDVQNLRYIMSNFTNIVRKVLKDSIGHGIKMASVRMRQRSLLESIDNHAASIDRLNRDTARTKAAVTSTEVAGEENMRQIASLALNLRNFERQLRTNDLLTYQLFDSTSSLNSTVSTQEANIGNLLRLVQTNRDIMSDLAEMVTSLDEDLAKNKLDVGETIESVRQEKQESESVFASFNSSLGALENWSAEVRNALNTLDGNVNLLEARFDVVAGSLASTTGFHGNISHLLEAVSGIDRRVVKNSQFFETLQEHYSTISTSVADLKTNIEEMDRVHLIEKNETNSRVEEISSSQASLQSRIEAVTLRCQASQTSTDESIRNLTVVLTNVDNALTDQSISVESLIASGLDHQAALDDTAAKVSDHHRSIALFNTSNDRFESEISSMKRTDAHHTTILNNLVRSVGEDEASIQKVQTDQWRIESMVTELSARTTVVEEQISSVEAKVRSSQSKVTDVVVTASLERRFQDLASNLTEVEDRILMLEFDQDSAFNITTYMLDELHDHSSLLERMNQTAARQNNFDVESFIESIASTLGATEHSVSNINESLTTRIQDLEVLLTDFQMAFDTSGRQMERLRRDLKIMDMNTTNYIRHFVTTTDFLRQIVSETNEDVAENYDRIRELNDSVVVMQLDQHTFVQNFAPYATNRSHPSIPLINGINGNGHANPADDKRLLEEQAEEPIGVLYPRKNTGVVGDDESHDNEYFFYGAFGSNHDPTNSPGIGRSPVQEESGVLDLKSILDGDADEARIAQQTNALLDPSIEYDDSNYDSDYLLYPEDGY